METVRLIIDGAVMESLLRGPDGAVSRFMMTRAEVVRRAAVIQCPKRTGKLSRSILKRSYEGEKGVNIVVGAYLPYAVFVHEGTKAHTIAAKNAPMLAFAWPSGPFGAKGMGGTGLHFYKVVHHPGTKPNRFLSDNLRLFFAEH